RIAEERLFEMKRRLAVHLLPREQTRKIALRFGQVRLRDNRRPKVPFGAAIVATLDRHEPHCVVGERKRRVDQKGPLEDSIRILNTMLMQVKVAKIGKGVRITR